jgi:ketol-acid reductoisomerase
MDDISFQVNFQNMMIDWDNDDVNLLTWRAATAETFKTVATTSHYFWSRNTLIMGINDCNG